MPVWPTLSLQTAFNTKAGADVFRQNQLLQATRAPTQPLSCGSYDRDSHY